MGTYRAKADGDGNWSSANNWWGDAVPTSANLTSGDTIDTSDVNLTLDVDLTVPEGVDFLATQSNVVVASGKTLTLAGDFYGVSNPMSGSGLTVQAGSPAGVLIIASTGRLFAGNEVEDWSYFSINGNGEIYVFGELNLLMNASYIGTATNYLYVDAGGTLNGYDDPMCQGMAIQGIMDIVGSVNLLKGVLSALDGAILNCYAPVTIKDTGSLTTTATAVINLFRPDLVRSSSGAPVINLRKCYGLPTTEAIGG